MNRLMIILISLLFLCIGFSTASALPNLAEYAFNIDSIVSNPTHGDPVPAGVDISGFDDSTGLGSISITIESAGDHSILGFFDHEIDEAINTFFNEFGTTNGTPATGQSWEIDEPGFVLGDINDNFIAGDLDNYNEVPNGSDDDVSMAMGWDFNLGAGEAATIVFLISETIPAEGFFLSHTDPDSGVTIYFSSTMDITPSGPVPIEIDIKPGSNKNPINLKSKGKIPVAIITTDTFDATTVDPLSVKFGPNGATESHRRGHIKDVDGDGDLDLVLHLNTQDTGIQCGDSSASLTGSTFGGVAIEGSDSIMTKGCR